MITHDHRVVATKSRGGYRILAGIALFLIVLGPLAYLYGVLEPYWIFYPKPAVEAAYHSDFYPRWFGARGLIKHGIDPYSTAVTKQIQEAMYGHMLGPGSDEDPQGFAYPVYLVLFLAPLAMLPAAIASKIFIVLVFALSLGLIPLFNYAFDLQWGWGTQVIAITLLFTSFPMVQALFVYQPLLLVLFAVAACVAAVASDRLVLAGLLLAVSCIKPQLACGLVVWLTIWSSSRWKERRGLMISFLVSMTILIFAGEWLLHGWITKWIFAARAYSQYSNLNIPAAFLFPRTIAWLFTAAAVGGIFALFWKLRRLEAAEEHFAFATALAIAATLLVVPTRPMFQYNHLMLLPSALLVAHRWNFFTDGRQRLLSCLIAAVLGFSSAAALAIFLVVRVGGIPPAKFEPVSELPLLNFAVVPIIVPVAFLGIFWKRSSSEREATSTREHAVTPSHL